MRKFSYFIAAAGLAVGLSQAASAADLPRKAPAYVPPPPPPLTWTGCYIGANVGGAWGRFRLEGPFGGQPNRVLIAPPLSAAVRSGAIINLPGAAG